jgi:hypothetical protein
MEETSLHSEDRKRVLEEYEKLAASPCPKCGGELLGQVGKRKHAPIQPFIGCTNFLGAALKKPCSFTRPIPALAKTKIDWATLLFVRPYVFDRAKWEVVLVRGRGFQTIKSLSSTLEAAIKEMGEEAKLISNTHP